MFRVSGISIIPAAVLCACAGTSRADDLKAFTGDSSTTNMANIESVHPRGSGGEDSYSRWISVCLVVTPKEFVSDHVLVKEKRFMDRIDALILFYIGFNRTHEPAQLGCLQESVKIQESLIACF